MNDKEVIGVICFIFFLIQIVIAITVYNVNQDSIHAIQQACHADAQ